ncbi:MAG: hypothetical protein O6945_02835 [Gammaproteobacteria bacterium]|nr:hypothetical protein [Gammaproteobacteria bacterium]
MGALRNLLLSVAVAFIFLMPFASAPVYSDEWDLFFGGVLPATAPIIIIVLMLDVMMSQVWKDAASQERIQQLNFIIKTNCLVAFTLLLAFLSIFFPVLLGS